MAYRVLRRGLVLTVNARSTGFLLLWCVGMSVAVTIAIAIAISVSVRVGVCVRV